MNCLKIIIKKTKKERKKKQSGLQGLKDYMSVLRYFHSWVLIKINVVIITKQHNKTIILRKVVFSP